MIPAAAQEIDFYRDIVPIFAEHCFSCHGPQRSEAGLSLYTFEAAERGGDSGGEIVGGSVESNELLKRIKSTDPAKRMPLEADALPAEAINVLERWVEQGTPWPSSMKLKADLKQNRLEQIVDSWIRPNLYLLIGFLILIAITERLKGMANREVGVRQGLLAIVHRIGPSIYLKLLLCIVIVVLSSRLDQLYGQLDETTRKLTLATSPITLTSVFGDPPVPIRPAHGPRLGGTYYRGNDERDGQLFNGGHYRTATLNLSLVDEQGRLMEVGSAVQSNLRIRLEVQRATNATMALFSEKIMSGLMLSPEYRPEGFKIPLNKAAVFTPAETSETWESFFPLNNLSKKAKGVVYLYRGKRKRQEVIDTNGVPHIGIVYNLSIKEGRITEGSELWMDALYFPKDVSPPADNRKVPWFQWFDYRPIPLIQGAHTDDSELLGTNGHIDGGNDALGD